MALIFTSGFDIFGPTNSASANVAALLTQGEWTSAGTSGITIVAPLSATGFALNLTGSISVNVTKTLSSNYARLIGGFRFSAITLGGNGGIIFQDGATAQASITINASTGTIAVRNGTVTGTALGTSTASITTGTTHYLEFDVTFGNAGVGLYQVFLDGVSVLSGGGDTTGTANNYANSIVLGGASTFNITYDDFYLLDSTGAAPLNAPLLTSPRIETQFPSSDGAVQFAAGAAVLGNTVGRGTATASTTANQFYVRSFTPTAACTITAVGLGANVSSGTINLRPIVYSDNTGTPNALLGSGSISTAITAGTPKILPLTSGIALSAGTTYWLGYMSDIAVTNAFQDSGISGRSGTSTFASGAPGTAPSTSSSGNAVVFGVITLTIPNNAYEVSQNPSQGAYSYVYSASVGFEDLYNFPPLSVVPSAIYATAVKASVSKSDAGAKTVSVRQKSGATDSAGSGGTQAPGTSFAWLTSLYSTDPNTGAAWTLAALNAAQGGVRVES